MAKGGGGREMNISEKKDLDNYLFIIIVKVTNKAKKFEILKFFKDFQLCA